MNNDLRIKNHKSYLLNHKSTPLQYQKGWVEFYKLRFKITPDVLIPRPETELLTDEVLEWVHKRITNNQLTILDLGTGAGNIAISIAKNISDLAGRLRETCEVCIIATDISAKALKLARQNAKLHNVQNKITFIQSNLLNVIASERSSRGNLAWKIASSPTAPRNDVGIDIIVTNLPYIPSERIPYLDPSVKDFEPLIALDGGNDGFDLYRKLFQQIKKFEGAPLGWKLKLIIGEIDYTHGQLAANVAQKFFPEARIEIKNDLAKKQRILLISNLLSEPGR